MKLSQNIHIMIPHQPTKLQLDTTSTLGVRAMDVGVGLCRFFSIRTAAYNGDARNLHLCSHETVQNRAIVDMADPS